MGIGDESGTEVLRNRLAHWFWSLHGLEKNSVIAVFSFICWIKAFKYKYWPDILNIM